MHVIRRSRLPLRTSKIIGKPISVNNEPLNLDKVLILNKVSRFELEKLSHPHLSSDELEKNITKRGLDYRCLLKHHQIHKDFQNKVVKCLESFGVDVREVNRFNCTIDDLEWCNAVFPIGGDGTFLHAARKVLCQTKPVIGFNSDPARSEGFLCLPVKYSFDVASAIKKLIEGNFRWMFRTRIRVTLSENLDSYGPTELCDIKFGSENTMRKGTSNQLCEEKCLKQKSPILALNEVFMSEIFAAKVSYFEMRINNSKKSAKIKSSGLCICTGTGSTSWNLSINRLSRQDVHDILMLYISETNGKITNDFENSVKNVFNMFNERFKFGPEEEILGYTIRDFISLGVWPQPKGLIEPRGFAKTIELKSMCSDAAVIVDGGISFPFNEGAVSHLEIFPEDALKTVVLKE